MARRIAAIASLFVLAACAGEPSSQPTGDTRTIPAPPPMPEAEIPEGGAPADLRTAHASACTLAVFREVPRQIGEVQRVQADDASLASYPADGDRVRVTGAGRFYRTGADWRPFTFDCLYDQASGQIASFDVEPA